MRAQGLLFEDAPPVVAVDLALYDLILVNTSAGKDSQAMMDRVVELASAAGVLDRVVAVHCDLGRVEWTGTRELAEEHAAHYGMPLHVVTREKGDLLEQVEARGMWPSARARYCTSDHKRSQVHKLLTRLVDGLGLDRPARVLNCLGIRAEESPARAKKPELFHDKAASNKTRRHVTTWHPIHHWTEAQVWERIRAAGTRHHRAYDLGMKRLSCVFCIFAPRAQLELAGRENPDLLDEYVEIEKRIGHTFKADLALEEVQAGLAIGAA